MTVRGRIGLVLAGALAAACLFAPQALALGPVSGSPFATGSSPYQVAFSPTGTVVATANAGVESGATVSSFTVDESSDAVVPGEGSPFASDQWFGSTLAFSQDGNDIALAGGHVQCGGSLSVLAVDQATGALSLAARPGAAPAVNAVAWGPNGMIVLGGQGTCLNDDPLELVKFATPDAFTSFAPPALPSANDYIDSVAVSPTLPLLATANGSNNTVSVFAIDEATGAVTEVPGSPFPSGGTAATQVAFNAAGTMLAVASFAAGVTLFRVDPSTGELTRAYGPIATDLLYPSIAFGHDLLVVSSPLNGDVLLYGVDEQTGKPLLLPGATTLPDLGSLALSPDDGLLAVTNPDDDTVSVFATADRYQGPIGVGTPTYDDVIHPAYADLPGSGYMSVPAGAGLLTPGAGTFASGGETLSVVPGQFVTAHGVVTVNADGSFSYFPDSHFVGTDTFAYVVANGGAGYATATATVNVVGPVLSAPTSIDFGTQEVGQPAPLDYVTITNAGTDSPSGLDLDIANSPSVSGPDSADFAIGDDTCPGRSLKPGQSCSLAVEFTPSAATAESATLTVGANNAVSGNDTTVSLTGVGVTPASTLPRPSVTTPSPSTTTAVAALGRITCVVSRHHRRAVVRCTTSHPAVNTALATVVVKRGSRVLARGRGQLTGIHLSASLRLRRALYGKDAITVTITVPGVLDHRVVHATFG